MMAEALAWHEVARYLGQVCIEPAAGAAAQRHQDHHRHRQIGSAQAGNRRLIIPEAKRKGLPHRVLNPVPTHKLADEAREKMPDGVTVAVWQGREGNQAQHHRADVPQSRGGQGRGRDRRRGRGNRMPESQARPDDRLLSVLRRLSLSEAEDAGARRPMSCSRRTRSLFQVPPALGKTSAWSSSTRRSGQRASPARNQSPA